MAYQFSQGRSRILSARYPSAAAASTNAILAATADAGEVEAADLDAQPDVPRNITATAGGTAADVAAVSVVVHGFNVWGEPISETLPAFTVDTAGTVAGSKAFASITSVELPEHDDDGATVSIGYGDKLGLPVTLDRNTVVAVFVNGVKEATTGTVTFDADEVEKNTVDPSTALSGVDVIVDYYK